LFDCFVRSRDQYFSYILLWRPSLQKNILGRQSASQLDGLSNCFLCCFSIQFLHGGFPLTPVYYFRHTWLSYIFRGNNKEEQISWYCFIIVFILIYRQILQPLIGLCSILMMCLEECKYKWGTKVYSITILAKVKDSHLHHLILLKVISSYHLILLMSYCWYFIPKKMH
jgi:hypothetical protein